MILNVGKKVVYPNQGPCRVGPVVKKDFGGRPMDFYPLAVMDDSGNVLFVPVDKIKTLGIRQLMEKSALDNSRLLASGSALDLAQIIGTLTELNGTKALSPRDRQVLDRARRNLICEISEVMGKTKIAAEQQVDDALKVQKRD